MPLRAGVGGKVGIDGEVHGACFARLQEDTCVTDEAPNGSAHPGEGVTEVELDDFRAGGATGVADGAADPDGTVGGCGGRYVVLHGVAVDPGGFPGEPGVGQYVPERVAGGGVDRTDLALSGQADRKGTRL